DRVRHHGVLRLACLGALVRRRALRDTGHLRQGAGPAVALCRPVRPLRSARPRCGERLTSVPDSPQLQCELRVRGTCDSSIPGSPRLRYRSVRNREPTMATTADVDDAAPTMTRGASAAVALACMGVVFGDIGTSPLYAFKEAVKAASPHGTVSPEAVLGVLSLIFWSLILVISIKY